ncbi:hypothetical protein N0V90_008061 [Kalmusia sp. IMI 367209]|nr:hypothetical protein N0V90_008061 [Kalmusia sp. IMI 367209]
MTSFDDLIQQMLLNAPDPNEQQPISNRKETIWGTTMPFLFLCWAAVALRMWVRIRVMREPGWDDALVMLAVVLNTVATVFVLISIKYGLGHHFLYLGVSDMTTYIKAFYDKNKYPNAKCYGFGFGDTKDFISLFESHTALNMVFDVTIFLTPMVLFRMPNLRMKNIFAMAGIFVLGAVVVFTSVWRLYSIVDNRAATHPYIDFTWWPPISIILSCLEIDLAIMCASMPIFWPVIEQSFAAIFVTKEIQITEQRRYSFADHGLAYELEHSDTMRRQGSMKSESATSRESLVIAREMSGNELDEHYKDPYLAAQVDPFRDIAQEPGIGVQTNVDSKPKDKWRL